MSTRRPTLPNRDSKSFRSVREFFKWTKKEIKIQMIMRILMLVSIIVGVIIWGFVSQEKNALFSVSMMAISLCFLIIYYLSLSIAFALSFHFNDLTPQKHIKLIYYVLEILCGIFTLYPFANVSLHLYTNFDTLEQLSNTLLYAKTGYEALQQEVVLSGLNNDMFYALKISLFCSTLTAAMYLSEMFLMQTSLRYELEIHHILSIMWICITYTSNFHPGYFLYGYSQLFFASIEFPLFVLMLARHGHFTHTKMYVFNIIIEIYWFITRVANTGISIWAISMCPNTLTKYFFIVSLPIQFITVMITQKNLYGMRIAMVKKIRAKNSSDSTQP